MMRKALLPLAALLVQACAGPIALRQPPEPVTVGIIAFNDFHGNLEPPRDKVMAPDGKGGAVAVPAGGGAWLASAVKKIRARYAHHATVAAGDLISGSPLVSAHYLDEPAIGVLNRIGLEIASVGNHEFDRGAEELLRMQHGGCARHARREPCQIESFGGARFAYLAASTRTASGGTLLPATVLRRFGRGRDRVTVGFIGLTLKATPLLVMPDGVQGLTFEDEADTINTHAARLRSSGADAVVVLLHEGGSTAGPPDPNGCADLSGDIRPILERLRGGVDVIVSGHTHRDYVCRIPAGEGARPLLLTSAGHHGRLVTDIALRIDPAGNRVVSAEARNIIVQSDAYTTSRETVPNTDLYPAFDPDAEVAAYVSRYAERAKVIASRPAGRLAGPAARDNLGAGNSGGPLGNLIADAQLAATASAGAQIAFINPFGIRAPLAPASDGTLTYGDLFAAQPFDNPLVTQTMTGAQIRQVLEQCFDMVQREQILSPSAGFSYSFDRSRPVGQRIVAMTLNGEAIREEADYRVTTNVFLMSGGDGFSAFTDRRDAVAGMIDLEALEAWLGSETLRTAPIEARAVDLTGRAAP